MTRFFPQTQNVNSWEEFLEALNEFQNYLVGLGDGKLRSEIFYRGLSNYQYLLQTTLERTFGTSMTMDLYHTAVEAMWREMKMHYPNIHSDLLEGAKFNSVEAYQNDGEVRKWVSYMMYLRHHGFPSPILDWTESMYVAAYFAFIHTRSDSKYVSICVFAEKPTGKKIDVTSYPTIHSIYLEHDPNTDRHSSQKSRYTVCIQKRTDTWFYSSHENAFSTADYNQDVLIRFNIPSSEREKVLGLIRKEGVTTSALFGKSPDTMIKEIGTNIWG